MSWFSKNYEKALLAGTAVVALGLGYVGWSKMGAVEADFPTTLKGRGNNETAVKEAELIPKAQQSLQLDRTWNQAKDGERPVNLFTGIPLFVKNSDPEKPIDLLEGDPVHEPIPNTWWLENRLDPGFGDSPDRDPDGDGFSNLEEFKGKTNPNNGRSTPPLIAKLKFVKDETLTWAIRPGYGTDGGFPFSYKDSQGRINKLPAGEVVRPDGLFFIKEPMANRFKFLGSEVRKELNKRINVEMENTYVRVEDQKPNKKGRVYEIPAPLSEERMNDHRQFDRSAVLTLEAVGLEGREFKVEENTSFSLPPSSNKKDFLLKEVTPEKIVVEYPAPDGSRKSVEITKGSTPRLED